MYIDKWQKLAGKFLFLSKIFFWFVKLILIFLLVLRKMTLSPMTQWKHEKENRLHKLCLFSNFNESQTPFFPFLRKQKSHKLHCKGSRFEFRFWKLSFLMAVSLSSLKENNTKQNKTFPFEAYAIQIECILLFKKLLTEITWAFRSSNDIQDVMSNCIISRTEVVMRWRSSLPWRQT